MDLVKIKDVDGYKKDESTGAILATDKRALQAYKKKRTENLSMKKDINNLKEDMKEIKEMLALILSSQKDN